MLSVQVRPH